MSIGPEQIFLPESASNLRHGVDMRPENGAPTINTTYLENVKDFTKVCRVCATVTELVVPIYEGEGLRVKLADKIKRHLPIKVTKNDELPLVVCFQCIGTLLATHELVLCSLQADAVLRSVCAQRQGQRSLRRHRQRLHQRQGQPAQQHHEQHSQERQEQRSQERQEQPSQERQEQRSQECQEQPSPERREQPSQQHEEQVETEGIVEDRPDNYRRCEYCPVVVLVALYNSHLLGCHADLLFHCDECNSYVARRLFLAHMSRHALQYEAVKRFTGPPTPFTAAPYLLPLGPRPPAVAPVPPTLAVADSTTPADTHDDDPAPDPDPADPEPQHAAPAPDAPAPPVPTPDPTAEPARSRSASIDPVENPGPAQLNRPESTERAEEPNASNPKKTPAVRRCPHCPKTYTASSSYFYHLKYTHGKSREHECPACGRRFGTRGALREHASLHEPTPGLRCDRCGKRSRTKAGHYIHAQTHKDEKEKKFLCAECGRAFRWRAELQRHLARHAARRAHACECGRAFSVRADLLRHARTHRRAAHACPQAGCGATFAQPRYLRAHEARKHAAAPDHAQGCLN